MISHLSAASALALVALAAPATAIALPAPQEAVPASAEEFNGIFTEVPGLREFTGVLCARPLQPGAAESLGLLPAELRARADAARDALTAFDVTRYVPETDEYLLEVPAGETESSVAKQLLATRGFQYVEPDWLVYPIGCPNDPQFSQQWHHQANRMRSCDAWNLETGDPSVVVAICDTGIRATHQDLLLHRQEGYHAPSQTWENSGGPIDDINGHGTLCAGTAAANGDNGTGVSGVGWNLGHRTMRVTDSSNGSASLSNLTNAARTAADAGDRVASVSYSGVNSSTVRTAGTYVRSRNALLVWAAGNDSSVLNGNRDDDVIVVGATTSADALAGFSNRGPLVDLTAPGAGIRTTSSSGNSSYANVSGTSFACPMTAGLCALIWSRNPNLSPAEVEQVLRDSCDDLGAVGVDDNFGYGRINSLRAMQLAPPPSVSIAYPNGLPEELSPAGGDVLDVVVTPGATSASSNGAVLWFNAGGGFQAFPIASLGSNTFRATFPSAACPSDVEFYLEFALVGGGSAQSPASGASAPFTAVAIETNTVLFDDVESGTGWTAGVAGDTATTGIWTLVDPNPTAAAPGDDHTPGGTRCFVTGQGTAGGALGENDVDGGFTTLITPSLDLTQVLEPRIGYWRWYTNAGNGTVDDQFQVDISEDGGATWVNVETLGPNAISPGWQRHTFAVSDFVGGASAVQLRFIASDTGGGSIVEAAIDDLEVFEACPGNCGIVNYCTTTPNSTGTSALISSQGSASFGANDLVLIGSGAPANVFGLFITSPDATSTPASAGTLCVGSATLGFVLRMGVVQTDSLGLAAFVYDNTMPVVPVGQVAPDETWYFQFVYRDNAGGTPVFNFSDGLAVTFCQ